MTSCIRVIWTELTTKLFVGHYVVSSVRVEVIHSVWYRVYLMMPAP